EIATHRFPLHRSVTVVGRASRDVAGAPDLDLTPFDPRRVTSRRHAELACVRGAVYLRDLGSSNGTRLRGRRLRLDAPVRLSDGDRVSFAEVEARFVEDATWPTGLEAEWAAGGGAGQRRGDVDLTVAGPR